MKKICSLILLPLLLVGCNKKLEAKDVVYNILNNHIEASDKIKEYEIVMVQDSLELTISFDDEAYAFHQKVKENKFVSVDNYVFIQDYKVYTLDGYLNKGKESSDFATWIDARNEAMLLYSTIVAADLMYLEIIKAYYEGEQFIDEFTVEIIDESSIDIGYEDEDMKFDVSFNNYLLTHLSYSLKENNKEVESATIDIKYDVEIPLPNPDEFDYSLDIPPYQPYPW